MSAMHRRATTSRRRRGPRDLRNGAIAFVILSLLLVTTMTRRVPFWPHHGRIVAVQLASGVNLNGTTPVRVNGVDVGKVSEVRRAPSGRGVVARLRISEDGLQLRKDATAAVHYRTLLGLNVVIDLDPGSPSAAPLGDQPIPLAQTRVQPEIDEVLRPLDKTARSATQTAVAEFDRAFARPGSVSAAVDGLAPGLSSIAKGLPGLRGTAPGKDLPQLVRTAGATMGALSRQEVALGGLIDNADTTMAVTAARGDDIAATLRRAPSALATTAQTMTRLNATLDELDPLAARLLPGVRQLAPTLTAARAALDRATPLLDDAGPTLRDLSTTTRQLRDRVASPGGKLITDLQPTIERLHDDVIPFLQARDDETKMPNYQAIGPTIAHADSLTSHYDAYGHSIVFEPSAGTHVLKGADCTTALIDSNEKDLLSCKATLNVIAKLLGGLKGSR